MTIDSPTGADRLEELLFEWQERADRGDTPTPEELCRDCPELAPELARRVRAVCWVEKFAAPPEPRPGETTGWAASGGAADEAPPTIPGYGPLEKIAQGGMGVVYKALNLEADRIEAVKTIRDGEFAGPKELAQFRFEAKSAAKLAHPNVVTLYGVGEVNGRPYLTMRWIDGCSLANSPRYTPGATAALVAKVARAVHYAHQRGILHRDLKPHNILVDADGEPHVADFGIARPLDRGATVTEVCNPVGTPAYMSPEQTRCEPHLTVASDVFALGVVLYERLTGRMPFNGVNHYEVMKQVREAEPRPPRELNPAVDPDLEAICLKCLEKDPADRYATAGELADDLDRYGRGELVQARPPGLGDWLRQVMKTRPEPNPHYSWEVCLALGWVMLLTNGVVFAVLQYQLPTSWLWFPLTATCALAAAALWWYMVRRFRQLPETERHSLMIGIGVIAANLMVITAAVVAEPSGSSKAGVLGAYPAMTAITGLALFIIGSTHWSRFVLIGLAVMALTPVTARWPDASPLIFGSAVATVMWYWTYTKRVTFRSRDSET